MKDGKMICAISIEPHGVMVMARWLARKAAIEQLGSQGHKVQYSEPAGTYEATEAIYGSTGQSWFTKPRSSRLMAVRARVSASGKRSSSGAAHFA